MSDTWSAVYSKGFEFYQLYSHIQHSQEHGSEHNWGRNTLHWT